MKKTVLLMLSMFIVIASVNIANAKTTSNSSLSSAIKLYKSGNYAQSYTAFSNIVAKDPSNAVAYYYLAMSSAQVGKKNEAISNYEKVLSLSPGGQLERYAVKGKVCLESPDKCHEPETKETEIDKFIKGKFGSGFSNEARGTYEKQKIENLMREMNRENTITPQKFKEYKDFSSEVPTNDEIVTALRTLQRAGLSDMVNGNNYRSDLSLLTGESNNNNNYEMLNLLLGNGHNSTLSPQVIQSLLTNQMSASF